MFGRKRKVLIVVAGGVIAAALGGGAIARNALDSQTRITGEALTKASRAALEHTRGGRVTDSEVGDEEGYYEVEVTLEDGRQIDVHLDQNFNVIGEESDEESPDDVDSTGESR